MKIAELTNSVAVADDSMANEAPPRPRQRRLDAAVPAALLLIIAIACFVWPLVATLPEPTGGNVIEANRPLFSPGHLLGTDLNGNDILSRLLHGGRSSLGIAFSVNLLGLALGGLLGALAAHAGGSLDSLIMRVMDVLIAFPSLVLVLAVAQALGPSYANTVWALMVFSVPAFARIARASALRVREQPFMLAARMCGTPGWRVLVRHIAPNILPQLATFALLGMGMVIIVEGALSYLGLGVPLPQPSWGNMIAQGQEALAWQPALVLLPSTCLFITVLALNLLGEALRSAWSGR